MTELLPTLSVAPGGGGGVRGSQLIPPVELAPAPGARNQLQKDGTQTKPRASHNPAAAATAAAAATGERAVLSFNQTPSRLEAGRGGPTRLGPSPRRRPPPRPVIAGDTTAVVRDGGKELLQPGGARLEEPNHHTGPQWFDSYRRRCSARWVGRRRGWQLAAPVKSA